MERRWALADSPDASGRTTPKAMTDVVWLGRNGRVVVQARREIAHCFNHSLLGCAGAVLARTSRPSPGLHGTN